jgi:hypothetical protein
MKLCGALKRDGTPCLAAAVLRDPEGHCVFHSSLTFPVAKKANEITKEEAIRTVGRELRCLRRRRDLDPLQRSSEIRSLIQLWQSLTAPEVEPPAKPLTYAEKVRMLESEGKRKGNE